MGPSVMWDRRGWTAPELVARGKHASPIKSSGEPRNASVQQIHDSRAGRTTLSRLHGVFEFAGRSARASDSKAKIRKPLMVRGTRPLAIPMHLAIGCGDRQIVDACKAMVHQTIGIELPILVAVGTEPVSGVVMPFVGEAHGNPRIRPRPQLLDQPIIEFLVPLA